VKQGVVHEFNFLRVNQEKQEDHHCHSSQQEKEQQQQPQEEEEEEEEEKKTLLVRELPIENADNPFDDGRDQLDTTGLGIWSASIVMARWMADKSLLGRFDGKNVLELGAGCGVPGLAVGLYSAAKHVYLTDYNPATMENLKYNIDVNSNRPSTNNSKSSNAGEWLERVTAASIDWNDETTWPKERWTLSLDLT
jgi:Predicted methyltransferase